MDRDTPDNGNSPAYSNTAVIRPEASAPLPCDVDVYREDLGDLALDSEEEAELLRTLWHIMSTFVDIGWGVGDLRVLLPELFDDSGGNQEASKALDSGQAAPSRGTTKQSQGGNDDEAR